MSAKLAGKIHRYNIIAYAKAIGIAASNNALRTAKHLWLALAEHYNDESGQCNPSIPTLMSCIELSHGPTVEAKNLLLKLKLISILKNAKGGRHSCWYDLHFPRFEEFSRPVNRTLSHPLERIPELRKQDTTPPVEVYVASDTMDVSTPADRIRTLSKTLTIPYLTSLEIRNKAKFRDVVCSAAKVYGIDTNPPKGLIDISEELKAKLREVGM